MASDRSFPRNYGCYRGEGLDHLLDDNVRRVQDRAAVLVVALHLDGSARRRHTPTAPVSELMMPWGPGTIIYWSVSIALLGFVRLVSIPQAVGGASLAGLK